MMKELWIKISFFLFQGEPRGGGCQVPREPRRRGRRRRAGGGEGRERRRGGARGRVEHIL